MTNFYPGLARGPIDHEASSVINIIANEAINMGSATALLTTTPTTELLPRVDETDLDDEQVYGIAVGGDRDGIYGTGAVDGGSGDNLAADAAGQGIVIVTQGRCLARVNGDVPIGSKLVASTAEVGALVVPALPAATDRVIAIALQDTGGVGSHIIAVDVQRQGAL